MYVCIHAYVYTCMCVYVLGYVNALSLYVYVYVHKNMYVCMYVYLFMYMCTSICKLTLEHWNYRQEHLGITLHL